MSIVARARVYCGKVLGFLRRNRRNLYYFWKYALAAKLHLKKYKSSDVMLLRLDLIGDCTMFTSAACAIRKIYKDRKLTLVCLASSKPIYERLNIFDRIIDINFKPDNVDFVSLNGLIEKLRKDEYALLLQPQASKYPLADIIAAAVRCNKRIAIETKVGNSGGHWIRMVNFLYDQFIPLPRGIVSEFDYYGAFVRGLGCPDYKTTCPVLPYKEQHFMKSSYYVLFPGGSLRQKFWPAERFAMIADYIFQKTGLQGVILGAPNEKWVSDKLMAALSPASAASVTDLTGKTSLDDVIDLIGNAELVVSNDTSGVHIACATRTPSVAINGGWHFRRFLPYHIENVKPEDQLPLVAYTEMPCYYCEWIWAIVSRRNPDCLRRLQTGGVSPCIEKVTFEQVREKVEQILKDRNLCKEGN